MFCHSKPNVTQTNFHKLHPKLHPYQHEVDRLGVGTLDGSYYRLRGGWPRAGAFVFLLAPSFFLTRGHVSGCCRPWLPAASASHVERLWSLGTARSTMTLGGSTARAPSRSSRLRGATCHAWDGALLCAVALVCCEIAPECAVCVLCVSVSSVSLCLAPCVM